MAVRNGVKVTTEGESRHRAERAREEAFREESARAREAARLFRSPREQLRALDLRLGRGVGASKERKRLLSQLRTVPAGERESSL